MSFGGGKTSSDMYAASVVDSSVAGRNDGRTDRRTYTEESCIAMGIHRVHTPRKFD